MASYNAGRSVGRLLTDGAFDALERDASGYVSAADAADQLLMRRRRSGQDDDDKERGNSSSGDVEMRSFLESMVASFCRSKPGRLNRREFALLYETFLKRPAEFSRLMMQMRHGGGAEEDGGEADEGEEEEEGGNDKAEDAGEKGTGCKESDAGQRKASLQPAPQMSRDQLRSLVDEVNRRLADENEARAKQPAAAAAAAADAAAADAAAAASDIDDLHLD